MHLLHSLHAKTPFECVIVTYTWGSEESLKHAEWLVKMYIFDTPPRCAGIIISVLVTAGEQVGKQEATKANEGCTPLHMRRPLQRKVRPPSLVQTGPDIRIRVTTAVSPRSRTRWQNQRMNGRLGRDCWSESSPFPRSRLCLHSSPSPLPMCPPLRPLAIVARRRHPLRKRALCSVVLPLLLSS